MIHFKNSEWELSSAAVAASLLLAQQNMLVGLIVGELSQMGAARNVLLWCPACSIPMPAKRHSELAALLAAGGTVS